MKRFLTYYILLIILTSCSQFSRRPAAIAFHNINAKYNAIWQAERVEKELIKSIEENSKENYRNLLPIIAQPDSNVALKNKEAIDKIIKKASLVIDRHQNSSYMDDAYFLIGKGRIYQSDWKNAIETFKYVNSIDPDKANHIGALLNLLKIYIQTNEFQEADKVNEYVATLELNKIQKKDFYLLNAWLLQKKKDPSKSIAILEEAIPLISSINEKSRILYILGQLHFLQNNEKKAISYFEQVSKIKGNYELAFQAKLAIAQILDEEATLLSMLKESKNEELKPFIYVALGQIYYQKNNFEKAKEYWTLGAKNADQKGELYLQLGHLFAKQFRKPKEAIAYYDSAVTFLAPTHSEYAEIKKLTEKWKKYDQLVTLIQLNDSLLNLSGKSEQALKTIYNQIQVTKNSKKDSSSTSSQPTPTPSNIPQIIFTRRQSSPEQQSFYFNNDMVRIRGEQDFVSKWGMRSLEDHWNRKTKNNSTLSNATPNNVSTTEVKTSNSSSNDQNKSVTSTKDSLTYWLEQIPRSIQQITETQKKLEKSIFESGKFAKFELNDNDLAKEQLALLLKRFPQTSFEAEALYLLYISEVQNSNERAQNKKLLFEKYPDSHFKTLVLKNETGSLSDNKEIEAKNAYEKAFLLYKDGKFDQSFQACLLIDQQFPGSSLEDKILYLKAINKGALKDLSTYENLLTLFIQSYPKSKLLKDAEDLLKTLQSKKQ